MLLHYQYLKKILSCTHIPKYSIQNACKINISDVSTRVPNGFLVFGMIIFSRFFKLHFNIINDMILRLCQYIRITKYSVMFHHDFRTFPLKKLHFPGFYAKEYTQYFSFIQILIKFQVFKSFLQECFKFEVFSIFFLKNVSNHHPGLFKFQGLGENCYLMWYSLIISAFQSYQSQTT